MRLLSSKSTARLDEAALLAEPPDPRVRLPERLASLPIQRWRGSHEQAKALLDVLAVYREHRITLRARQEDPPIFRVDLAASIDASPDDVVLVGPDGRSRRMDVGAFLDANVTLALIARLERSWQARPPHAWSDWDRAVAWAEERHDPHGGAFDLPPAWRGMADHTLPLFGWRLDLVAGVTLRHDVAVITLHHDVAKAVRYVPLFDVGKCFRRGQTPAERIRSRPVRLPTGWDQGWIRSVALAERRVVVDRIAREASGKAEVVELGVDVLIGVNPDLPPLIEALASHELTELRRRLEAHSVAGGLWVATPAIRDALGRPHMPLTGWHLGERAFVRLARGEVHLTHRVDPDPLVVSVRHAAEMMRLEVPPAERLFGDPSTAPDGSRVFVRSVDPRGCWVTPTSEAPLGEAACIPHGAWVRANPDLADALLMCVPDIGCRTTDPGFRTALRDVAAREQADLSRWAEVLEAPAPVLHDPLAVQVAAELLERGSVSLPSRWTDVHGVPWRWVGTSHAGFVFQVDQTSSRHRGLPGPASVSWEGVLQASELDHAAVWVLTPEQLPFASLPLARHVHAWQISSGVVHEDGAVADLATRVGRLMARTQQTLTELCGRSRQHLALSRELHEDPLKARAMQRQLDRLRTNLQELGLGRGVYVWLDAVRLGRLGVGLAAGGVHSALRPACDDRLRLTESIQGRYLGRFRLAVVGGGGGFGEEATGPLVWALLDDLENRVATALHDTAELVQVQAQVLEAICAASHATGQPAPFCSFAAVLTHLDSGTTWVFWCGNSRVWRYRREVGELRPLTFDHTFEGLVALGVDAGLRREDAIDAVLHVTLGRRSKREVETVRDEDRMKVAERFKTQAGRRAIRAALGGSRDRAQAQHARLLELLQTYHAAYEKKIDLSAVETGAEMVFAREVRVRPGERLIVATDGLSALAERRPLWVQRAVDLPDPQRTVEWLIDGMEEMEGQADDLAVIVLDPDPTIPYRSGWSRRDEVLLKRTSDQEALLAGGVVPGLHGGGYPALRLDARRLARWYAEVDDLIRRGKLPAPDRKPLDFAVAVARWAAARPATRDRVSHADQQLRALHEVLDERNDDPLDETLLVLFLLRKHGLQVRYAHGLRIEGEGSRASVSEACWLELVREGGWVIDVPRAEKQGALPQSSAYAPGAITLDGGLLGIRKRELQLRYVVHHPVSIELPAEPPEVDEPFVRLDLLSRTPLPLTPLTTLPPSSQPSASAGDPDDTPTVEAPKTSEGFLDLDM
jgi:serine/threonine protein phosphatase PrpC